MGNGLAGTGAEWTIEVVVRPCGVFPPGSPMSEPEEFTVAYSLPVTSDELAGLLGTYSGVITMDPDQRAEFSRRVRAFLDRQPWDQVDLPMICRCLKSTRLPG